MKKLNSLACAISIVLVLVVFASCGQLAGYSGEFTNSTEESHFVEYSDSTDYAPMVSSLYDNETVEDPVECVEPEPCTDLILDDLDSCTQTQVECCGYIDPKDLHRGFYEGYVLFEERTMEMNFLDTVFGGNRAGDGGFNLDIAELFFLNDFAYAPGFDWLWPFSSIERRPTENSGLVLTGFPRESPPYYPTIRDHIEQLLHNDNPPRTAYHIHYDNYGISFRVGNLYVTIERREFVSGDRTRMRYEVSMLPMYDTVSPQLEVYDAVFCFSCIEKASGL